MSVTRFGEISPLWHTFHSLWDIFGIVLVWYLQTFVPTLAIFMPLGQIFNTVNGQRVKNNTAILSTVSNK